MPISRWNGIKFKNIYQIFYYGKKFWSSGSLFAIAGVPSSNKMYGTSAAFELHSVLYFTLKSKVDGVHFVKEIYTFDSRSLKGDHCTKLKIMINEGEYII